MSWLKIFDASAGINKAIEGAFHAGWKPARNFYEGVRGTTKYVDDAGETVKMSPARKLARRLKNDTAQVLTGNRYDMKNNLIDDGPQSLMGKHVGNRLSGALHLVGDATLGTLGTALGWGARMGGVGALWGAKTIGKPAVRGVGHFTKQGLDYVGDTAIGAFEVTRALNKGPVGRGALFGAGLGGAGAIGGIGFLASEMGSGKVGERALQFYSGQAIDSVPGTISGSGQMVDNAGKLVQRPLDNMGADGDLVLAMHNLR